MQKAKVVQLTEDITNIVGNKFIFNKETKKGFFKRDLDVSKLPETFTFKDVVDFIEAQKIEDLESMNVDTVYFEDGETKISNAQNSRIVTKMSGFMGRGFGKDILKTKLTDLKTRWIYNSVDESEENEQAENTMFLLKMRHPANNGKQKDVKIDFNIETGETKVEIHNEDGSIDNSEDNIMGGLFGATKNTSGSETKNNINVFQDSTEGIMVVEDGNVAYGTGTIDYILTDTVTGDYYTLVGTNGVISSEKLDTVPAGKTAVSEIVVTGADNKGYKVFVENGYIVSALV